MRELALDFVERRGAAEQRSSARQSMPRRGHCIRVAEVRRMPLGRYVACRLGWRVVEYLESIAAPRYGVDQLTMVAERFTDRAQMHVDVVFFDEHAGPYGVHQFVLGHDAPGCQHDHR
ncbi:hypothetical protein [Burkholderia vietnamiensis]|uniref:hypothetical protein n=1 Tax=Burkholderia vietnamiensis TaxID=60552 RepID=UPI002ECFF850